MEHQTKAIHELVRKYKVERYEGGLSYGRCLEVIAADACAAAVFFYNWRVRAVIEVEVVNTGEVVYVELQSDQRTAKLVSKEKTT